MFSYIEGKLLYIRGNAVVVENSGIGYKIAVTAYAIGKIAGQEIVRLHLYTHVREDVLALYGFLVREELDMFELLLSVTGIGPKAALGILTIADPKTIRTAVIKKDASVLTRVSGIGKKTAERVILELGNKIDSLPDSEQEEAVSESETIEILVSMGYSAHEAREASKHIASDIVDISEKIKTALKYLGKK